MFKDRKYNIRGVLRDVRQRRREEKKNLSILNHLSIEDLKNSIKVDGILKSRSLYTED